MLLNFVLGKKSAIRRGKAQENGAKAQENGEARLLRSEAFQPKAGTKLSRSGLFLFVLTMSAHALATTKTAPPGRRPHPGEKPKAHTPPRMNTAAATLAAAFLAAAPRPLPRARAAAAAAAAAATAAAAGASAAAEYKSLAGRWHRDAAATDLAALGAVLEAMRLSYLQRQGALHLIDAIELEVFEDGAAATVQHLAKGNAIPQRFLAKEEYRRGAETHMRRRDLRAGEQRAIARALDPAERMLVEIQWGGELPGRVEESYVLGGGGDRLEVTGRVRIGARDFLVRQVYARE